MERIKKLFKDEEGATMVEYALMIALIAAVCVFIIGSIGDKANTAFETVDTAMP